MNSFEDIQLMRNNILASNNSDTIVSLLTAKTNETYCNVMSKGTADICNWLSKSLCT